MSKPSIAIPVAAALLMGLHAERARAQGAPLPPPPRVTPSSARGAAPASGNAGATAAPPVIVPRPAVPPPPPKTVVPASAVPPKDSAVALCNNGTWITKPGSPTDCASRGGLRVAVVQRTSAPPVHRATATQVAHAPLIERGAPAGSTMRCKDGTYLAGAPAAVRCANNGGVAATFPATKAAPTAPSKAPSKRP